MKSSIFLFLFIVAASTGRAQTTNQTPEEYGYKVEIGQQIPEFKLQLANGKTITTNDLKGKIVMLQFTASWCSVCRKEMPHIENEIWQKHKNNSDFMLIGVDLDEPLPIVQKFAADMKITYPLALDPEGKIFYTFAKENAGVTRNVIIDKTGKIVFLTRLYKPEEFNEMKDVIDLLLKSS